MSVATNREACRAHAEMMTEVGEQARREVGRSPRRRHVERDARIVELLRAGKTRAETAYWVGVNVNVVAGVHFRARRAGLL